MMLSIRKSILLCNLLLISTAAFGQFLPVPESVPVNLAGDALVKAENGLVGRGVVLGDLQTPSQARPLSARRATVPSACGWGATEILWREVRREVDPQGGSHVFYQQHLVGKGLDAELVGSEIAVHRLPDGRLAVIGGRQFDAVTVGGCPASTAAEAVEAAHDRVLLDKGGDSSDRGSWAKSTARAKRLEQTRLKLVQIDGTFRPAYFTYADDADGEPYAVVIDAEDKRPLAVNEANPGGNCAPSTPLNLVTAYGIPVRPEITNWRGLKANVASRDEGYTHEGVILSSDGLIRNFVYQAVSSGNTTFVCASGKYYTLVPLKVDPAKDCCSPVYDDDLHIIGKTDIYGRAAGDALYNTYKTMNVFKAMGRNGWDNANGDAGIIVQAGLGDQGKFNLQGTSWPLNVVMVGPANKMYSGGAALDLVAHEWGHGVISKTAKFSNTTVGAQLNEGFADVIGMLVEKRVQSSGTGLEHSSDWTMHEDMATSGYARGAIDDGTAGHNWVGPDGSYSFNDRLHRCDGSEDLAQPHATGNMLNVVHLIMAAGGSTDLPSGLNPVCTRLSSASGLSPDCAQSIASGCASGNAVSFSERLGSSKAGTLLFYAIQFTLTSNTTWSDVANRVNEAAFMRYSQCQSVPPYNASVEQNTVRKAFAGIGYPRTEADKTCP
jgi:hypothetical protein